MDTIAIECPNGHRLTGPSSLVGHKVRCPKCAAKFELTLPPKQTLTETACSDCWAMSIHYPLHPNNLIHLKTKKSVNVVTKQSRFMLTYANIANATLGPCQTS